jgi:hypothetical protein
MVVYIDARRFAGGGGGGGDAVAALLLRCKEGARVEQLGETVWLGRVRISLDRQSFRGVDPNWDGRW